MSSNTGPAELAEILADPEKRDRYIVLSLIEIKQNQALHSAEDERRFSNLEAKMKTVSSSADDYDDKKAQFEGGWKALAGLLALGMAVWGCIQGLHWIVDAFVKAKTP